MKKIFFLLTITVLLTSCGESFLEVPPTAVVIPNKVSDFDIMLNADGIQPAASYVTAIYLDPDVNSHSSARNYGWPVDAYRADQPDTDFNNMYRNVYVTNYILANIDEAPLGSATEEQRTNVKGAAYAERASTYFSLVNIYGPHYGPTSDTDLSVPLVLAPDLEADEPNATVKEIYDQILSDLKAAESLISPGIPYDNVKGSLEGVYGLLSKVYLYMGDFENALVYADKCLEMYSFLYDYNTFENGYDDVKLQYFQNEENIWCKLLRVYGYSVSLTYSPQLLAIYDRDHDLRYKFPAFEPPSLPGHVLMHTRRITEGNILISVPDMYLIRAECRAHAGDLDDAVSDLNTLRVNRIEPDGYNDIDATGMSKDEVLLLVRNERRRELAFSGQNIFDLKRYYVQGRHVDTYTRVVGDDVYTLEPGSEGYYMNIAPAAIVTSKNMVSIKSDNL